MIKIKKRLSLRAFACAWIGILVALPACSATGEKPLTIKLMEEHTLNDKMKETSGLVCTGRIAVTINDSGNDPVLFSINSKGQSIGEQPLDFKNKDWEAVTADHQYFYIGDVGNNDGRRDHVMVRKVSQATYKVAKTLKLIYKDNDPAINLPYAHDFDAESLVYHDRKLILFSKSWASRKVRVYHVDPNQEEQALEPVTFIDGLPGIITGADWDPYNNRFVVVGYNNSTIGLFRPFVATISEDYQLTGVARLEDFAQVEGVCVKGPEEIWVSQEKSPLNSAKLARMAISR